MARYISILILIGLAYGQSNLDLLIFKGGLKYYGEFLKVENNKIYFKPKNSNSYQSILSYRLDRVELKTGEVLNFKEVKKPKEPISEKKVIKKDAPKNNELPPLPNIDLGTKKEEKKEEKKSGELNKNSNQKNNTKKDSDGFKMDTSFLDLD